MSDEFKVQGVVEVEIDPASVDKAAEDVRRGVEAGSAQASGAGEKSESRFGKKPGESSPSSPGSGKQKPEEPRFAPFWEKLLGRNIGPEGARGFGGFVESFAARKVGAIGGPGASFLSSALSAIKSPQAIAAAVGVGVGVLALKLPKILSDWSGGRLADALKNSQFSPQLSRVQMNEDLAERQKAIQRGNIRGDSLLFLSQSRTKLDLQAQQSFGFISKSWDYVLGSIDQATAAILKYGNPISGLYDMTKDSVAYLKGIDGASSKQARIDEQKRLDALAGNTSYISFLGANWNPFVSPAAPSPAYPAPSVQPPQWTPTNPWRPNP